MSNFTNLNEIFHIFSKTPVADGQTLASARNKSGHTVTTSDIWAEDIPAFFSAPTQTYINNLKTIAKDNDLCYDETNKSILYFKNSNWVQRNALKDGELLANYEASKLGIYNDGSLKDESKAVVKYYKDRDAIAIDGNNNNTADGNRYTARIAKGNTFVPQFVSSMDKIVNGNPSTYYEPVVNGGNITEDIKDKESTTKYIANNYSGIIQFHKQIEKTSDGKLKNITISAFEYIGKKLNSHLNDKNIHINRVENDVKISGTDSQGNWDKGLYAYGFILKLPKSTNITSFKIRCQSPVASNVQDGRVIKVRDYLTNRVIATSKPNTTSGYAMKYFEFPDDNHAYCVKNREYKITFHSSAESDSLDVHFPLVYASDGAISNVKKYIFDTNGSIKTVPSSFVGSDNNTHTSEGFNVTINGYYSQNEEFENISNEFSNIYEVLDTSDNVSQQALTNHINNKDVHVDSIEQQKWDWTHDNFYTHLYDTNVHKTSAAAFVFPDLSEEERQYYIIHDGAMNPVYISFADELDFGISMFRHRPWKKFHIDLPNLQYTWRMFHDNSNMKSIKSAMTNMKSMVELCPSCDKLEYIDLDLSNLEYTGRGILNYVMNNEGEWEEQLGYNINDKIFTSSSQSSFKGTPNLKSVKIAINSRKGIVNFLKEINEGGYGSGDYSKKSGKKLTIGYYTTDEENKNKTFNIYSNEEITSNWNENNVGTHANLFFEAFKHQIKDAHNKGWVINYDSSSSQDLYDFCINNNIITINTEG